MRAYRWHLLLALLVAACGGHSETAERKPAKHDAAADAGTADVDPATNAGAGGTRTTGGTETGGTETGGAAVSPQTDVAGAEDQAQNPGYAPHIGSGTRSCESAAYCFGLACYAPASFLPTVCVEACDSDLDCGLNEACVRSERLAPTCYGRCRVPGDCEYHFDCMDFSGDGQLVCFPSGWAGRRDELGN